MNVTSVLKAPFFASKPYYHDCNDSLSAQPEIVKFVPKEIKPPGDKDDIDLYYESYFDMEPNTGAVIGAAQKLLISAYIDQDDLFEGEPKFVPIYKIFRTANFTEESTLHVFGDLLTGLMFKQVVQLVGVCLCFFFVSLLIFAILKIKFSNRVDSDQVVPLTTA
jgi:hypothetical protein